MPHTQNTHQPLPLMPFRPALTSQHRSVHTPSRLSLKKQKQHPISEISTDHHKKKSGATPESICTISLEMLKSLTGHQGHQTLAQYQQELKNNPLTAAATELKKPAKRRTRKNKNEPEEEVVAQYVKNIMTLCKLTQIIAENHHLSPHIAKRIAADYLQNEQSLMIWPGCPRNTYVPALKFNEIREDLKKELLNQIHSGCCTLKELRKNNLLGCPASGKILLELLGELKEEGKITEEKNKNMGSSITQIFRLTEEKSNLDLCLATRKSIQQRIIKFMQDQLEKGFKKITFTEIRKIKADPEVSEIRKHQKAEYDHLLENILKDMEEKNVIHSQKIGYLNIYQLC